MKRADIAYLGMLAVIALVGGYLVDRPRIEVARKCDAVGGTVVKTVPGGEYLCARR